MAVQVLFAAGDRWDIFEAPLKRAFDEAGLDVELACELDPAGVEYVVYSPYHGLDDFTPFTKLKAVLNLWAGVEKAVRNDTLHAPLTRMVDDEGLTRGMVDYVTAHVTRYHVGTDHYVRRSEPRWDRIIPPLAADRTVAMLGMGALGAACADALAHLGFRVRGWSRRPRAVDGVEMFHGDDGLAGALSGAEIVVLLLPLTGDTRRVLNAERIELLADECYVINPGRGGLVDDDDLLDALDRGRVTHATLDTFRQEPLPDDHRYWHHPRVTVTPHIASDTRPSSAARVVAENIRRGEAGDPFLHVVDRTAGY